jgi:hypothetical protein
MLRALFSVGEAGEEELIPGFRAKEIQKRILLNV